MSSTSATFASFTSSSHFTAHKIAVKEPTTSLTTRVHFRPLRISAAYTTSTAERKVSHIANSHSSMYEVLGVQMGATSQEIKAAYRRLARVLHPDVSSNNNRNDVAGANEFIKVHEAYSTLSDPEKRADYDRTLLFRQRRSFSVSIEPMIGSTYSGYTGRTWETDQFW